MELLLLFPPYKVRTGGGGYYGLVVVTPPCPRPHFIVYAIT